MSARPYLSVPAPLALVNVYLRRCLQRAFAPLANCANVAEACDAYVCCRDNLETLVVARERFRQFGNSSDIEKKKLESQKR